MRKLLLSLIFALTFQTALAGDTATILHVSYDPTRELSQEVNQAFQKQSKEKVDIRMSHGGSSKQARAVIDGLDADVVSLALSHDIDMIAKGTGKLPANWRDALPNRSVPFTSTIVFMVRKGNPKQIKDWDDLARDGVQVATPNPQSSGGARWIYLSAWGFGQKKFGRDKEKDILAFVKKIYSNVPVLDAAARGSTITFAQRGIGDVLVTWENEAMLATRELGKGKFEIVYPSLSIVAEPAVAVLNQNTHDAKSKAVAKEYAEYFFKDESQRIIARRYFRPVNASVAAEFKDDFPKVTTFRLEETMDSWDAAQKKHFDKGGTFEQIYTGK